MGVKSRSDVDTLRLRWEKIFKVLTEIIYRFQKEKKFLEDRIKMHHESYVCNIRLYEDRLSQCEKELEFSKMVRSLDAAKRNLLTGLKHRDLVVCRTFLGLADDEVDDFKAWLQFLNQETDVFSKNPTSAVGEKSGVNNSNSKGTDSKTLEREIRKLNAESEKFALEKNSEISKLLRENRFVWAQYKHMENEFEEKLKEKNSELDLAGAKILSLQSKMAEMEADANKRKQEISRLAQELDSLRKSRNASAFKVAEIEANGDKQEEEISGTSQGFEPLKKKRSASVTPLVRCTSRGKSGNKAGASKVVFKEESPAPGPSLCEKVGTRSRHYKRKKTDEPKLFTSAFKIPKLKI